MGERERIVSTALISLVALILFGALVHRSPYFAGSLLGGIFGILAASFMALSFLYIFLKRLKWIRTRITRWVTMRVILQWHIFLGLAGAGLGVVHTGHKFDSPLGIILVATMLLVVVSGFVGRYLLSFVSEELRAKKRVLSGLEQRYHEEALLLASHPERRKFLNVFSGFIPRMCAGFLLRDSTQESEALSIPRNVIQLSESISDVEYAIYSHERLNHWLRQWTRVHLVLSVAMMVFLLLHIWSAFYFGIRWLQ